MKENTQTILADIHILATDKAIKGCILKYGSVHSKEFLEFAEEKDVLIHEINGNKVSQPQYLYAVSDEEIKEGDWIIAQRKHLRQCTHTRPLRDKYICLSTNNLVLTTHCKKVIATTNPELWTKIIRLNASMENYNTRTIEDIPKIPTTFLQPYIEAYNSGKKIEEVRLEVEEIMGDEGIIALAFKESDFKLKLKPNGSVIIHPVVERTYTRMEVLQILYNREESSWELNIEEHKRRGKLLKEWFDKNYPK